MGLIDKIKKNEAAQKVASNNSNKEEDLLINKEELKYLLSLIKTENNKLCGMNVVCCVQLR